MSAGPDGPGAPVIGEGAEVGADVRLGAFVVVLLSAAVDVIYALLDPRIRLSG